MSICRVLLACLVSFNCVFFLTNHKKSITNLIKKNVIERRKKKEHCSNPLTVIPPRKKISFSVSCNCNIIRNQFINLIKKMIFKKKKKNTVQIHSLLLPPNLLVFLMIIIIII